MGRRKRHSPEQIIEKMRTVTFDQDSFLIKDTLWNIKTEAWPGILRKHIEKLIVPSR